MLSRLLPRVRQVAHANARTFSHLTANGKTETEVMQDIANLGGSNDYTSVRKTGETSFALEPTTEEEVEKSICDTNLGRFASEEGATSVDDQPILSAIGLDTFQRKATMVAAFGLTALSREWYVLNEETFVMCCLAAGFTTMYTLGREPALKWYEDNQKEMLSEQQEAENRHMAACETLINMTEKSANVTDEIEKVFNDKVDLLNLEAQADAIAERNRVKSEFSKKLQTLVNQKSDEEMQAYKQFLADTSATVRAKIQEKSFKTQAIKYAITALTDPAKAGEDPTAALFRKSIKN